MTFNNAQEIALNYYRVTTIYDANLPETHPAFRPVDKTTTHYIATNENMPAEEEGPGVTCRYERISKAQWDETSGPGFEADVGDEVETRTALLRADVRAMASRHGIRAEASGDR